MSRRAGRKRKEDEALAVSDDDEEERKENKRGKTSGAAAPSSSAAAAAASPARTQLAPSVAASSSPSASAAASSSSRPPAHVEDVKCGACWESFTCADDSAHLPRTVPCGHLLCTACIRQNLALTPGSVPCPLEHGPQTIRIPAASAAAAMSTVDDWIRLLPPALELIASIKNQQSLLTQLGQKGAHCSHVGCAADVTHYCPECGDLCSTHERKLHALARLQPHKSTTMLIADKAAFYRNQKQSKIAGLAADFRSQAAARLLQKQGPATAAEDELRQLEAQVQQKRKEVELNAQELGALKQTADRMRAADDSTVLEMEADRLEAQQQQALRLVRSAMDSTVLNAVADDRISDLLTFLGPDRLLSKATLIYRASRDGFEVEDWWRMCGGKSNTLTIVRVSDNGFVCGAFASFRWPVDEPAQKEYLMDRTGTTFLFSLVNGHDRAVKLRLKESRKARAGISTAGYGPAFGNDLRLMNADNSADGWNGNLSWPTCYEFDSVADGGAPIKYDKTLLAGDDGDGLEYVQFAAAEIESWQL